MYILILTYVLNTTAFTLPKEEYTYLSFCVKALDQSARTIHKQGGRVISASCELKI